MPMGIGPGLSVTRGGSVTGIGAIGADLALWFDENQAYKSSGGGIVTPDSILTYAAPSPKMVYGSDGVLRYAPHNFLLQSQTFNTTWGDTIGGTGVTPVVTADAGSDPTGSATADRIQFSLGGGTVSADISRRRQNYTAAASPHTFSVYLRSYDGSSTYNMHLTDASGATRNIVVTGSWQRFEVTATAAGSSVTYAIGLRGGQAPANSDTADVLAWGAQLNRGSSALTYVPTTSAAVYSLPRDYNPTTLAALGVLVEEARTNLLTYSEQFDNAAWVPSNVTVTAPTAIVAPDGTTTADLLTAAAGTSVNLQQSATVAATSATYSVYAKKNSGAAQANNFRVRNTTTATTLVEITIDYDTGTIAYVTGSTGASAVSVGNGWWRIVLTATSGITSGDTIRCDQCFTGITTIGYSAYIWGAQLEAGAFATSYIPTVASQVTRAADQISILTSAFPYSQTEGTLFTISSTVVYNDGGAAYRAQTALRNAGNTNFSARIRLQQPTTTTMQPNGLIINTTTQADLLPTAVALTEMRAAMAYKVNDAAMVVNGGAASIDVICTIPSDISSMDMLGGPFNNGATHIKRLAYYASRKDNSTLQVLST